MESPAMSIDPAPPRIAIYDVTRPSSRLRDAHLVSPESGEIHVSFDEDACTRLGEGDLLRLPAGGDCCLRAAQGAARIRVLHVGRGWLAEALGLGDCTAAAPAARSCLARAGSEDARRARRLFDEHARPAAAERAHSLRQAALRLELLALALETPTSGEAGAGPRRPNPGRAALVRLVSALRDASLEEVSLSRLARELGLSERQVSRLFREEFGTTFREHVASLRLDRAKRLLAATDLPVIEVAGHTGWSSLAHFNAVFRRRVGVTPSAFRAGGTDLADRAASAWELRTVAIR
jgi:AraC-like DNA-binding protein